MTGHGRGFICSVYVSRHTGLAWDAWKAHSRRESHTSFLSLDPPVSADSEKAARVVTDICNRNDLLAFCLSSVSILSYHYT